MIFRAGSGLPIKKTDLQQQITKNLKNLNVVIERTTVTLKEMYGYDLQTCDAKHNYYSIANSLPDVDLDSDESSDEEPEDVNKILILLILTHIFMSNGRVSEGKPFPRFFFIFQFSLFIYVTVSLGNFLKSFNIKVEQEHSLFGNVKHFINYLIKARYLCTEIEQGTQQTVYMWGSKAEKEISKLEILKFVANVPVFIVLFSQWIDCFFCRLTVGAA